MTQIHIVMVRLTSGKLFRHVQEGGTISPLETAIRSFAYYSQNGY